jgi:hypothetical protein
MADSFSLSVEQWVSKAKGLADAAFQATAMDALATVKSFTPVKTGFLRANWTVIKNNDEMPTPAHVQHPEAVVKDLRIGDRVLIVNPVVYAARIEYGFVGSDSLGRHYNQVGAGMAQRTIALLPEIARKATERVMAGGDPLHSPINPDDTA